MSFEHWPPACCLINEGHGVRSGRLFLTHVPIDFTCIYVPPLWFICHTTHLYMWVLFIDCTYMYSYLFTLLGFICHTTHLETWQRYSRKVSRSGSHTSTITVSGVSIPQVVNSQIKYNISKESPWCPPVLSFVKSEKPFRMFEDIHQGMCRLSTSSRHQGTFGWHESSSFLN
jgi:hypothetical protein